MNFFFNIIKIKKQKQKLGPRKETKREIFVQEKKNGRWHNLFVCFGFNFAHYYHRCTCEKLLHANRSIAIPIKNNELCLQKTVLQIHDYTNDKGGTQISKEFCFAKKKQKKKQDRIGGLETNKKNDRYSDCGFANKHRASP